MPKHMSESPAQRAPLSRERVLRGAIAVADEAGIRIADHALARRAARRQADVALPPRREQG